MAATTTSFIGDGEFATQEEGGVYLQRLWELFPWQKMRVHCPGRYFIPGGKGSRLTPAEVIAQLAGCSPEACLLVLHELPADVSRPKNKDSRLTVVFFPCRGGLLTYHKISPDEDGDTTYIHTLNTHSGLKRKLLAMGLEAIWERGDQFILQPLSSS